MRTEIMEGEKVVGEWKKHWFSLVEPVLLVIFFFSVTCVFYILSSPGGIRDLFGPILLISTLGCLAFLIWRILDFKTNIWIVTSARIIDEYGVLSHNAKESPLDKVNNVTVHQSFLGRIIGYGDIQIQTAAEMGATTYGLVSSPKTLKAAVTNCQDEFRKAQITEQAGQLAQAMTREGGSATKECPFCAETIKSNAKICRFCNKDLP